jgi:hypothetical protein
MKKHIFIVVLFVICCFPISGGGRPQKDILNYYYVQLKIVNLSDAAVDFYFNDLNSRNSRLDIGQEQITYKTPITDDYPGFIAIKRGDNDFEIYITSYIGEVKGEFYYTILIYNDEIDTLRMRDINDNYLDLIEAQRHLDHWRKLEISENNISIEIENHTGERVTIISNGYLFRDINRRSIVGEWSENGDYLHLENNTRCIYTINSEIFSLKYIYFIIFYANFWTYPNNDQLGYGRPRDTINLNNLKRRNIKILLYGYDIGYEIRIE